MENIDELKHAVDGSPRYRLANASVFVSPQGFHFIDYLDPIDEVSAEIGPVELSDEEIAYIERSLQSNAERFENQVQVVRRHVSRAGMKVLDIGCGGGLFLSKLRSEGAVVTGLELSDKRAFYAKTKHRLEVVKRPIESDFWQEGYAGAFDAVTLWDVIEHVNYPLNTLQSSVKVLRSGGLLFIDTPCRDAFYHRVGELTYRLSGGRYPTFLNAMYSAHQFGHKQIFSTKEMKSLFEQCDLEVIELRKFHELSFPYSFYLKKIFKSDLMVKLSLPLVNLLLTVFPVRNKMLIIGRRRT